MENKACINCKHCDWPPFATGSREVIELVASCKHPQHETRVSYVVGPITSISAFLFRSQGECGDAGNLFEHRDGDAQ